MGNSSKPFVIFEDMIRLFKQIDSINCSGADFETEYDAVVDSIIDELPIEYKEKCEKDFNKLYTDISSIIEDAESGDYTKMIIDALALEQLIKKIGPDCQRVPAHNIHYDNTVLEMKGILECSKDIAGIVANAKIIWEQVEQNEHNIFKILNAVAKIKKDVEKAKTDCELSIKQ